MQPFDLEDYDVPETQVPDTARATTVPVVEEPEEFESLGVGQLGVDEAVVAEKRRAPQAKLDAARILSDPGVPRLRRVVGRIKLKGKGHERRDLSKLLGTYQLWGHRLYPKANFDDFIALCWRLSSDTTLKRARETLIYDDYYGRADETSAPARTGPVLHEDVLATNIIADDPEEAVAADERFPRQAQTPSATATAGSRSPPPESPVASPEATRRPADDPEDDYLAEAMNVYEEMGF